MFDYIFNLTVIGSYSAENERNHFVELTNNVSVTLSHIFSVQIYLRFELFIAME